MPVTGSVVDLLNMAGQDSSFAARKQLATEYGMQGYTGTAAQNTDLSKKYLEAYNANKGKPTPQSGAAATSAIEGYFGQNQEAATPQDPIKSFMDVYSSMNPIEASIFQQLSNLAATPLNKQSLTDFYKQEVAAQGIPELNMELADIKRIMEGTEDDIRDEITSAGGFATESQVQALKGARNKNLIKQANYLADVLNAKNDYVDRVVSLTQADRKEVSDDLDRRLGITETLLGITQRMTDNAKENYMNIVDSVGWGGLAATLKGNKEQTRKVETLLGLAPGELSALGAYKKPNTPEEDLRLENLRLQNKKISQDLGSSPSISTQVVEVGGRKILINSKTGATIKELSTGDSGSSFQNLAIAQANIGAITSLASDPNIDSAVGPNPLARPNLYQAWRGGKSNFIAGVEQLRSNITLDNLISAKERGATFGALSDGELRTLSSAGSKLGTWAIKDDNGNIVGYNANEKDFKKELDKINNFSKLDFILKGGDPSSVGVEEMGDGTLWARNSDGTVTQIK